MKFMHKNSGHISLLSIAIRYRCVSYRNSSVVSNELYGKGSYWKRF